MRRACKITVGVFLLLGAVALMLVPLSRAGVLGLSPDPLTGIFSVLLAMPWFFVFDSMLGDQGAGFRLLMAAAGIGLNAGILGYICHKSAGATGKAK